ncbi:Uncharacterised protein [Mycobacteroides abscessus subsp. abscessus]|nr:hypothetical protein [Mycobacteroides abscessus]SKU84634.1 Uncharacterised protein [Mycobacteroides abscessus subsp. abscessus]SKY83773.1 Uncharacterised protein [Mycobacteroides abscessus subsp. abscessus]
MTKSKRLGPLDESGMHTVIETDEATPEATEATDGPASDAPQKPLPGDAAYDWSAHYGEDVELYRHTFRDGTVVALRPFGSVFSKTLLWKLRNAESEAEVQFTAIMRGGCPAVDVVLDRVAAAALDADDYEYDPIDDLFGSWMKAGTSTTEDADDGLSLGKSAS